MLDKKLMGQRIKQQRNRLKISQTVLAHQIGAKDKGTIWRMEKGITTPSTDSIYALAQVFHVSADWLLCLVEEPDRFMQMSDLSDAEREGVLIMRRQGERIAADILALAELLNEEREGGAAADDHAS